MKSIICIEKKKIDKITDILSNNGIEYILTHQYCFLDKSTHLSGVYLVYYLQYIDIKLKKVYKNKIAQILEGNKL